MRLIGRMVVLLGLSFCLLGAAAPVTGDSITITKEQWMQVQRVYAEQAKQLQQEVQEKWYWFDEYARIKACVREQTNKGELSGECIGDLPT